jgi:hypothetical protein
LHLRLVRLWKNSIHLVAMGGATSEPLISESKKLVDSLLKKADTKHVTKHTASTENLKLIKNEEHDTRRKDSYLPPGKPSTSALGRAFSTNCN